MEHPFTLTSLKIFSLLRGLFDTDHRVTVLPKCTENTLLVTDPLLKESWFNLGRNYDTNLPMPDGYFYSLYFTFKFLPYFTER